ncbi:MAG: hypothetical protein IK051_05145 [Rhodocyclaceae bacterium]|nr:hypothetical protein [Rhodocyclaceae bacterium]MBR4737029.1 hypothetical protein [Rhodocyclaceae bacterium]
MHRARNFALALALLAPPCVGGELYLCETQAGRAPVYQSDPCENARPVRLMPEPSRGTSSSTPAQAAADFSSAVQEIDQRLARERTARENALKQRAQQARADAKEAERTARHCDRLLERMETVDRQARHRSTQSLRDRKNRLQAEHRRLGCSWFPSARH